MTSNEDIALIGERQAAARRLLADPLITARTHPDDFAVVRSHSDWLIQRFRRVLGYDLTVAADHARLAKTGLVGPVARPLTRHSGAQFSPRTYGHLALCLAALVEAPRSVTVSRLAADVHAAAVEAGLDFDPRDRMGERRAFIAALGHLASWGAVTPSEGALRDHAADSGADVRLTVHSEVVRRVVAHPPHSTADAADFVRGMEADDPAGDLAGEVALRRMLAETAVVYRDDLTPRQRDRLAHHQWRAVAELAELLGCDAEIRAEGIALIMPDEADAERAVAFPSGDPAGQAALLLVERLIALLRPGTVPAAGVPVPAGVLAGELRAVIDDGAQRRWGRAAVSHVPDPDDIAARALRLLRDTGLMRGPGTQGGDHEGWTLLAAAARYGGRPFHGAANGADAPTADAGAAGSAGGSGAAVDAASGGRE
ncbi:TIGR02678 family protein [Nocardiopsis mangrovi]|uniref:TIGR02678 family protein n=1 Tax=Nocardiopsis mangrovi TaxID=1179818 RepID=A0ABV9E3E2_9ACTN